MSSNKRVDLKKILADPTLRRKLMVSTIQATQAREGVHTTEEQARKAYYVVSEAEKAAFLNLERFAPKKDVPDRRQEKFVQSLRGEENIRLDVPRRDFSSIEGSPLAYDSVEKVAPLFRSNPSVQPGWGIAQRGAPTAEDERLVRFHWEVAGIQRTDELSWEPFSKGGEFSRFYYDVGLRVAWSPVRKSFYQWYGRPGRPIERPESLDLFFQSGLTWPRRTQRGFNVRVLPAGCIFSDKSGFIQASDRKNEPFLLGILNSDVVEYILRALMSFGSYEVGVVKKLPVPRPSSDNLLEIARIADVIYSAKLSWDKGNEISTAFHAPWILRSEIAGGARSISTRLDHLEAFERKQDEVIQAEFKQVNDLTCRIYGISDVPCSTIRSTLGERPPEMIWPQMEGKEPSQKRMEHVWRLLSYAVKRIVEADTDGILPFLHVSDELPLLDRLHAELTKLFPDCDVNVVEAEINNELKQKVKGYDRVENIQDWLENVFFAYHASLYKSRPIFWHLASSQGKKPAAFAALVHYHRFDRDRMAKLRGTYLREAIDVFRREAARAAQDGRTDDHIEWQGKLEEALDFDKRLQRVQEGFQQGAEDYRILTPWKTEAQRPTGWNPDINDGVKVNIEPLQRAGLLRIPEVV